MTLRQVITMADDVKPNAFTTAARTIAALHREFPGVPVISTIHDWTYGTGDSPLSELDAHKGVEQRVEAAVHVAHARRD